MWLHVFIIMQFYLLAIFIGFLPTIQIQANIYSSSFYSRLYMFCLAFLSVLCHKILLN